MYIKFWQLFLRDYVAVHSLFSYSLTTDNIMCNELIHQFSTYHTIFILSYFSLSLYLSLISHVYFAWVFRTLKVTAGVFPSRNEVANV